MNKRAKIFVNVYTNSKYRGYKQPKFLSMSVSTLTVVFLLKKRAKIFVYEYTNCKYRGYKQPKILSMYILTVSMEVINSQSFCQ